MFEFIAFFCINFLGMVSPGPDFAIVTRYGLTGSRKAAFFAALGITTALIIHVCYCVLGVAVFLQNSPKIFIILQSLGAIYLGYIGVCLIREKQQQEEVSSQIPTAEAFRRGFLTNLLNPKATFFLLSLFTQFVKPTTAYHYKIIYAVIIPISALGWFGFLSYILTHPVFFKKIRSYQQSFSRLMGLFLVCLSLYVLGGILRTIL